MAPGPNTTSIMFYQIASLILTDEWGVYKILLEGDENVKCVYDPTDSREPHRCYKTEIIGVLDNELEVLHFERAIDYVYTNFCHYARASKPF